LTEAFNCSIEAVLQSAKQAAGLSEKMHFSFGQITINVVSLGLSMFQTSNVSCMRICILKRVVS